MILTIHLFQSHSFLRHSYLFFINNSPTFHAGCCLSLYFIHGGGTELFLFLLKDYDCDNNYRDYGNNNNSWIHSFSPFHINCVISISVKAMLLCFRRTISCYIINRWPFRKPRIFRHTCSQSTVLLWSFSFQKLKGRQNTEQSIRQMPGLPTLCTGQSG